MNLRMVIACLTMSLIAGRLGAQPRNPLTEPSATEAPPPGSPTGDTARGSLVIRGIQGTKGAPEVGAVDVTVQFVRRDQVVHTMETRLDEHGMVVINDLPTGTGVRPLVRLKYAGVQYQNIGPAMDAAHTNIAMDVTVYETTDEAPEWRVAMRHVMVQPVQEGLGVSEMVVVENPGDRTWLGGPANTEGRRPVVQVLLPQNARDVHLDAGFHGWCCTQFADRELTVQMPLMPGRVSYRFSYIVPAASGREELEFGARGPCDHALLLTPESAGEVELLGVEAAPPEASKEMPGFRVFQAANVAKGAFFGVSMNSVALATPAAETGGRPSWLLPVAGGGVGAIVIAGVLAARRKARMARASVAGAVSVEA